MLYPSVSSLTAKNTIGTLGGRTLDVAQSHPSVSSLTVKNSWNTWRQDTGFDPVLHPNISSITAKNTLGTLGGRTFDVAQCYTLEFLP